MTDNRKKEKFDPSLYEFGVICKYGHDYNGTGMSLRSKKWRHCIECHRVKSRESGKTDARKEITRRYKAKHGSYQLSDQQRQRKLERQRWRIKTFGFTDDQRRNKAILQYRYKVRKMEKDEAFAIRERLRDRLNKGLRRVAGGKKSASRDYGIDYNAIAQHLGPCPGDRRLYEIDHIIPLAAFDLTDPEEVKRAFAPENHQWLLKSENRSKGAKA